MTRAGRDVFSPEKRSAIMRAVKGADTGPELALRKALFALGLRYRLHVKTLPGKPDLVFPRHRAVIFVNGCFWHGHDCARGRRVPAANRDYWTQKIARNIARDKQNRKALSALGWRSRVVWECEIKNIFVTANAAAKWLLYSHGGVRK